MSRRSTAAAARSEAGRDIHTELMRLAGLDHAAGNSAAYTAMTAAASLALRLTTEHEMEPCS